MAPRLHRQHHAAMRRVHPGGLAPLKAFVRCALGLGSRKVKGGGAN